MLNWEDPIEKFKAPNASAGTTALMASEALAAVERVEQARAGVESVTETPTAAETAPPATVTAAPTIPATAEIPEETGVTGLEQVEFGANRLAVDDKQMINCRAPPVSTMVGSTRILNPLMSGCWVPRASVPNWKPFPK